MQSDNPFLIIIRPHGRMVAALFMTLILILAGVMAVMSFAGRVDAQARALKNQRASAFVTSLYQEAETANLAVQPLADQPCTDETLRRLRHIVAVKPHIRSVNIYPDSSGGCSSLEGVLPVRSIPYSAGRVPFYTTMKQESGDIYYMVYFNSPSHLTGVAINGYFVRDALNYIFPGAAFYPLQDFMELSPQGYGWYNPPYPFVLVSTDAADIPELLIKNCVVLFFIFAVSLFAGWLTYVSTGLMNTPRFVLKYYLHRKCFYPVYQPIISSRDNKVAGLEVLMRCATKKGQETSPALFIPLAEQSGMIRDLTSQLLTKVRHDLPLFADSGLYLSVNITSDIIECPNAISELLMFTEHARSFRIKVLAEITERQSLSMTANLTEKLTQLRSAGLRIAIDDFGSGYSNLSSISQLNPDYLKIDKDFTGYSQAGGISETLLESVLHISATTGIPAIAEGIETPAQLNYMRDRGVWLFQGYLFSPPCDARRISEYISRFPAPV